MKTSLLVMFASKVTGKQESEEKKRTNLAKREKTWPLSEKNEMYMT